MSRLDELLAITAKSKKPLPWYGLAMEYRGLGQFDRAVETFRKVHTLDPQYVAAYFMCGQVLAEQGAHHEARDELMRGIAVAKTIGDSHALGEMQGLLDTLD
jgi:tetratricopeptide (TPR) repeat protein